MYEPPDIIRLIKQFSTAGKTFVERQIEQKNFVDFSKVSINEFVNELQKLLIDLFQNVEGSTKEMTEDEFDFAIERLESVTFALSFLVKERLLRKDDVFNFARTVLDCICGYKDVEVGGNFERIFSLVIQAANKLNRLDLHQFLICLCEVSEFCFPGPSEERNDKNKILTLLSPKTISTLENDQEYFFATFVVNTILCGVQLFSDEYVEIFWPVCKRMIINEEIQKSEVSENWYKIAAKISCWKMKSRSFVEQLEFVDEVMASIRVIWESEKNSFKTDDASFAEILNSVQIFIEKNNNALMMKEGAAETTINWIILILEILNTEDTKVHPILTCFSTWFVNLSIAPDPPEFSKKLCFDVVELCMNTIKRDVELVISSKKECSSLPIYLDILASQLQVSRIQKNEYFEWIDTELNTSNLCDTPRWPVILQYFLSVQHPFCQEFFSKRIPSPQDLWLRLKRGDSRKTVNLLSFLTSTCHFSNKDEGGKQIIPILLLNCIRDLKLTFGNKWDSFRVQTGESGRGTTSSLTELEQHVEFVQLDEITKIRSVCCILQINRKPNQLVQLVADVAVSVITNARTESVTQILPSLIHFLGENYQSGCEVGNAIISNICERMSEVSNETIKMMCKAASTAICIFANKGVECSKCKLLEFCDSVIDSNVKMNERSLAMFLKGFVDNRERFLLGTTEEFLKLCRSILHHSNSSRVAVLFTPLLKPIDLIYSSCSKLYVCCWKLAESNSSTSLEKKIQLYIPVLNKTLTSIRNESSLERIDILLGTILNAKMPDTIYAIVLSSVFAHASVLNTQKLWVAVANRLPLFARLVVSDYEQFTENELLQAFVKRYASLFVRCLISSLRFERQNSQLMNDETVIRNILRTFITRTTILFRFRNISCTLALIRHHILYWGLAYGARGECHKLICSIIDCLCQELVASSNSVSQCANAISDFNHIKSQRKSLIIELLPSLIQSWRFEICKGKETLWRFCEEHCGFQAADMTASINVYRKEVAHLMLMVAAADFPLNQGQSCAPIVDELKVVYEKLHEGRPFSITSVIEFRRSEGIELLLAFRRHFANDDCFWMRSSSIASFRIIIGNVSKQFFDENWWTILLALRNAPREFEDTYLVWIVFVERIDYSILRTHFYRILADIENLEKKDDIIEKIWDRLNSNNRMDVIDADCTLQQLVWVIPKESESRMATSAVFNKYRNLNNVFKLIKDFEVYPITLFAERVQLNIDRGLIWRADLPKLVSGLIGIVSHCRNNEQKNDLCSILSSVPIVDSSEADTDFIRWPNFSFFLDPSQRTQQLLDLCALFVQQLRIKGSNKLDYADRTLCDVYRSFEIDNVEDPVRKATVEGLKETYMRMSYQGKPEPELMTLKSFDGFIQDQCQTFNEWLTLMIYFTIQESDPQFASFVYTSHVNDLNILDKLLTKLIIHSIIQERDETNEKILSEFEYVLRTALLRRVTKLERCPAAFVFSLFDFIHSYMKHESLKSDEVAKKCLKTFCERIIGTTIKDDYGHEVPLIVNVAEKFGMEKRCILWMEMVMKSRKKNPKPVSKQVEAAHYYTLMNLYARIHDLNGVRGAFARLSQIQVDHLFAKICLREAYGNVAEAASFYRMTEKHEQSEPYDIVQKAFNEINSASSGTVKERSIDDKIVTEKCEQSLISLMEWTKVEKDFGVSPHVFMRNTELRANEMSIIKMIDNGEKDIKVEENLRSCRLLVFNRIEECEFGGPCSYETAYPYLVQLQVYDEISKLKNATLEELIDSDSLFWAQINNRTEKCEQRLDVLEPILRVRRSVLYSRMKSMTDRQKQKVESIIVETHLHCARVARLHGCLERSQLSINNAKKVQSVNKKILFEEAMLQLQTSDEESGMKLLNSLLATTFGELTKHFGDTQQTSNMDLKNTAELQITCFPKEEKNLYSSVQMLRISHMIKAGNTIGFEKIYEETTNLLTSFVSSGVMYEAAWLLDYLFHFNERNRTVLPLVRAYREVAKYEKNTVLQARAIERMTSLWLENSRKVYNMVHAKKSPPNDMSSQMRVMNNEMDMAFSYIGWKAFFSAYAVLTRKIDHEDMEVFRVIKKIMVELIVRLPHQCMWQSVYLLRSNNKNKIMRYTEVLGHVRKIHPCYDTILEQYDYASAAFLAVSEKIRTPDVPLSVAVPQMKKLIRDKMYETKSLERDRKKDLEKNVMCGIMVPIRSDIDLSVQISKGVSENKHLEACKIDDRYRIHDFDDKAVILASMTKPVLIEVFTASGRKLRLICKKDDDLAKDYHFTKIVEMCNDLLTKDDQTRIRNMHATTYSVIPLAKTGGVIEFMNDVMTYLETLSDKMESKNIQLWANDERWTMKNKRTEFFRDVCCKETPLVMARWFRTQYPEAGKWFACRKMFAKSAAVMSMVGYIFGLGDRHTKNLLIHLPTGKCVHVDFDMILNKGEFLEKPEVVPFRLTRNMIDGMGEVAMDGEFRAVCEHTLRVFRENSYEIEKYIADLPDLVTDVRRSEQLQKAQKDGNRPINDMKEAKRLVSGRLKGLIVTPKLYRGSAISHPMKVVQLASSLIELATSEDKLAEMFYGWMPFY